MLFYTLWIVKSHDHYISNTYLYQRYTIRYILYFLHLMGKPLAQYQSSAANRDTTISIVTLKEIEIKDMRERKKDM